MVGVGVLSGVGKTVAVGVGKAVTVGAAVDVGTNSCKFPDPTHPTSARLTKIIPINVLNETI